MNVCPLCRGELVSRWLDADYGLTRCQGCNARFELSSLARADGHPEVAPPQRRQPVPMPPGAMMAETPTELRLAVRFLGLSQHLFLVTSLLWNVYLILFFAAQPQALVAEPLVLVHVVVGLALLYFSAAILINRRSVRVTRGRLRVRVGPLPWPGRLDVGAADLEQLFCMTHTRVDSYGGESHTYEVFALSQGRRVRLVRGLNELPQALWMEQQIERFLGIRDVPVEGETLPP